jgi:hypothetical protein
VITLILLNAPVLAAGGTFAPLLRFQPYNASYESMLAAIHLVWAVMQWRASNDAAQHALFIDFTMWANAGHGLVMIIATPHPEGPYDDDRGECSAADDCGGAVVAEAEAGRTPTVRRCLTPVPAYTDA